MKGYFIFYNEGKRFLKRKSWMKDIFDDNFFFDETIFDKKNERKSPEGKKSCLGVLFFLREKF